jgi:UDP-N-acetylglucosamine transferase subunit ALG13
MLENVEKADIVITHGGPSSFIMPLQIGKIPIVVPRQKKYNEHTSLNQRMDF